MAFRILALSFVSVVGAFASDVRYYPVNVAENGQTLRGLMFYFDAPTAATAEVTVEAIRGGKPITVSETIDTDREHGDRLVLPIIIDEARRHELIRMTIKVGANVYVIDKPRAGQKYELGTKRRT